MRNVSIIGAGSTAYGRHPDTPISALAVKAILDALHDANLERDAVGALYLGNFVSGVLTGQEVLSTLIADELGLPDIPCTKVEGACASGGIAFRHAWLAVATGQCDFAVAAGVEKMSHASTDRVTAALNCAMGGDEDRASGLSYPGFFGMAYRVHAERYGTSREQVSSVVIKNKRNGLANPLAQMGKELSHDIIAQSEPIADPLVLYDCCPISDGAAALVLTTRERAREFAAAPIDVRASVQTRGPAAIADVEDFCSFPATVEAARRAYAQAGIDAGDVDVVELHDCFSVAEIIDSEDLGLVPRGEGAVWACEGRTAVDGQVPINTSGGLLAKGHPVGATGVGQVYEIVQQLRGTHPNQVRDAAIGLTHNLGGTGTACTVSILARPDA